MIDCLDDQPLNSVQKTGRTGSLRGFQNIACFRTKKRTQLDILSHSQHKKVQSSTHIPDNCTATRIDLGRTKPTNSTQVVLPFVTMSAGVSHSVLLQSDGSAVACGENRHGQCNIPPLEEGVCYTQAFAGANHSLLLRSDGSAVACGLNDDGQCDIPPLEEGVCYTQVSSGAAHSVLLRSDGSAVACGMNDDGQCNIPPLEEGMLYTQVSAGDEHSVLLRSDGSAVACGWNDYGQCNIPPLEEGMCYTQVSAGDYHSVLLRSDGSAVACGRNDYGQCDIPPVAAAGCLYVFDVGRDYVLQAGVAFQDDTAVLTCWDLAGHEVLHLRAIDSDLAWDIYKRIAHDLQVSLQSLRLVLPNGQLLASICRAIPLATVADLRFPGQVNLSEPGRRLT